MSKSTKRILWSVVVAMVLVAALSVAFVFAATTDGTAFAMSIYADVEGVDNQLTLDVEPSSTIAEVKTAIYNETGIATDRLTISFNDTTLSNDASVLADYNIQKLSTLTVSVAPAEYVEFTVEVTGDDTRYVDADNIGDTVIVTYKITYNDGFNSILLVPEYDAEIFAIADIDVNEVALGTATITNGDGTQKILLENSGVKYSALDGENEYFLTITYEIIAIDGGEYQFGLKTTPYVVNETSVAYYIVGDEQTGEQTEVALTVVYENTLTLIEKQNAVIEIGSNNYLEDRDGYDIVYDYFFVYTRHAVGAELVDTLTPASEADGFYVEYTYTGDAAEEDIVIKWYSAVADYDNDLGEYVVVPVDELNSAPMGAGDYLIGISAPATDAYYEVEEVYGYVHINIRNIYVTIDGKSSEYGQPLQALTYTVETPVYEGDTLTITLGCNATSSSDAGSYLIGGSASYTGSYSVIFSEAYYIITKKSITLTALDQSAVYTGSAFVPDQTKYTLTSGGDAIVIDGAIVSIACNDVCINAGVYQNELLPAINLSANNYNVTYVNGTLTITTAGIDTQAINAYFTGLTANYNKQQHNLLEVDANFPAYYQYEASNYQQTNAGTYTISITVTTDSNHHFNDNQNELVTSVEGTINKASIAFAAEAKSHYYGGNPQSLTYTTDGTNYDNEIVVSVSTASTITASTAVGVYPITVSAANSNYNITLTNANYTVLKGSSNVTLTANDVYYNRAMDVTASAGVGSLSLTPVVKYYSDSACTNEVTPVNAGTYYAKATIAETDNYYGNESVDSFVIEKIALEGVEFSYDHGNAGWAAVTKDIGDANIKSGVTITYEVFGPGNNPALKTTTDDLTFTAADSATYYVVATASDDNYLSSSTSMVYSRPVYFQAGDYKGTLTSEMPATQYIFQGQKIVAPESDPTATGSTFSEWRYGAGIEFDFDILTVGYDDVYITAYWTDTLFTVAFKFTDSAATEGTDVFTYDGFVYGDEITYDVNDFVPTKAGAAGYNYVFANKWSVSEDEYEIAVSEGEATLQGITVTGNIVFVAVYNIDYTNFYITYYFTDSEGTTGYVQVGEAQTVAYGSTINYRAVPAGTVAWFKTEGWFADEARTEAVATTMPAENISVYAGYKFDIGSGDVNADGIVNADDITLYRQWIVGGYDMTVVAAGEEWATVTDEDFDADAVYFVSRVADNNFDSSRDIRDVSITRMAIVGGYYWDIAVGESVTGADIVRNSLSVNLSSVITALSAGKHAGLYNNITEENADLDISYNGSIYLDLNGRTLTLKSLSLVSGAANATITIKNGTIAVTDGITISAPRGNVVIEEVTAYVDGSAINLKAADNSLHFAGAVEFYDGTIEDVEPTPAAVNIDEGTHVVLEQTAEIVVEKIVVTENNFAQVAVAPTATISFENKAEVATAVEIEGNVINEISDYAALLAASKLGGTYVIAADFTCDGDVTFAHTATIDLNGHTITFEGWGFEVRNGATLTFNGNGNVIAQEAPLYAQYAGILVVNGGTYTALDNFVIGTHGSAGRGGNEITINGGVFNGAIESDGNIACGIYVANDDTVVINAGTFNVMGGVGIVARSGNTTIGADVVMNVTGDGALGKVGDSRVVLPTGKELILDLAAGYPGGDPTLANDTDYDVCVVVGTYAELSAANGVYSDIVLGADINAGDNDIVFTSDVNLDLGGHTITFTAWGFEINNGTMTIGNGAVVAREAALYAQKGGKLIVNDGTYTSSNNFVIGTNGNAGRGGNEITINGGVFNGAIESDGNIACGIYVANDDTVVINAGTFNITGGVGVVARSGDTTIGADVVMNVTGNGTLGKVGDSRVVLPTGKELILDLAAGYPGGDPTLANDTDYDVCVVVGTYAELAAANGVYSDIVLGADINAGDNDIVFTSDVNLDLGGHTITFTAWGFEINNGTMTIGNGSVVAQEAALFAQKGGKLIVNDGTYTSYDNFVIGTHGTEGRGNSEITVNGGVFNGTIQSEGNIACGIYVANNNTVVVNAGTFNITGGVGVVARSGNTTIGADVVMNVTGNGTLGKVGDSRVVLPTGEALILDLAANYPGGAPSLTNNSIYTVYTVNAQ